MIWDAHRLRAARAEIAALFFPETWLSSPWESAARAAERDYRLALGVAREPQDLLAPFASAFPAISATLEVVPVRSTPARRPTSWMNDHEHLSGPIGVPAVDAEWLCRQLDARDPLWADWHRNAPAMPPAAARILDEARRHAD